MSDEFYEHILGALQRADASVEKMVARFDAIIAEENRTEIPIGVYAQMHDKWAEMTPQQAADWIHKSRLEFAHSCATILRKAAVTPIGEWPAEMRSPGFMAHLALLLTDLRLDVEAATGTIKAQAKQIAALQYALDDCEPKHNGRWWHRFVRRVANNN